MRIALAAVVVISILALSACGSSMQSSSTATSDEAARSGPPSIPPAYEPIRLDLVRSNGAVDSVQIIVNGPIKNASAEVQVLRGLTEPTVVFDRVVQLTDLASPADGPPYTVALSSWSGSLAPSEWDEGCDHEQYRVAASVSRSDTNEPVMQSESPAFWCR